MSSNDNRHPSAQSYSEELPPHIKTASIAGLIAVLVITFVSSVVVGANTTASKPSETETASSPAATEPSAAISSPEAISATPTSTLSPSPISAAPLIPVTGAASPSPAAVPTAATASSSPAVVSSPETSPSASVAATSTPSEMKMPASSPEASASPGGMEGSNTKITDAAKLAELKQKLIAQIDPAWQTAVTEEQAYRIKVDEKGMITSYEGKNKAATDNASKTPLPSLTKSGAGDMSQGAVAEFEVIFTPAGTFEVKSL